MYKNIISDFGKVLVDFDADIMTSPFVKDEDDKKLVGDVVFDRAYWNKLDDGSINYDEIKKDFRNRLPERLWTTADKVLDNWLYNLPPVEGMRELYEEL